MKLTMPSLGALGIACLAGTCWATSWHNKSVHYIEDEARLYMQYARASFCTKQSLERWDCGDMCDDTAVLPGSVHFFDDYATQMQGYVAKTPSKECIAAFRGTVTVINYINDFTAYLQHWPEDRPSWCPGCKVHAGVAKSYKGLRSGFMNAITDLKCQSISFAGHSLGGAVVALASLDVRARGLQVNKVYTYGMLRTGNQEFVAAYLNLMQDVSPPMWRIVHYKDPVPRIPFVAMGYVHIPTEVYYVDKPSAHWKVCTSFTPQKPEDESCSWAIDILSCIPPFADPTSNHNMYMNKTTEGPKLPPSCLRHEEVVRLVV